MSNQHPVKRYAMVWPSLQSHQKWMAILLLSLGWSSSALAAPPVTHYEYDANGNLTKMTDGLNQATVMEYDRLNRMRKSIAPDAGQTLYGYSILDQLKQVTDPRNLITQYNIDALGNLRQQNSPDTGTTIKTYDVAGNVLTSTDAKGQVTTYTYDSLNRVTSALYHDNSQITYQYDQGTNGKGRLTTITDGIGSISYVYDAQGRILSETRAIANVSYVTGYTYNSAGRLTGMSYPSGRTLDYTLDSLGRISQISTTRNGVTQVLVSNITYRPFGPTQSLLYGNNTSYTRQFDQDGRITSYTLGSNTIEVGYDAAGRITSTSDTAAPTNVQAYNYDAASRLTSYTGTTTSQGYGYDKVGNRTALTVGGNTYAYAYAATSNRLLATQGPTPGKILAYDANGSPTADGTHQFQYDARGRLVQATTSGGTYQYAVNALGQRVQKMVGASGTVYHYDLNGQLIAESDTQGLIRQEYVYLGDMPVAVFK